MQKWNNFQYPHDFKGEEVHEFLYHFDGCDLVDILCMTEAMFSRHLESVDARDDIVALWLINKHQILFDMDSIYYWANLSAKFYLESN